jgi:uncharacterized SAM-binding protein YcdF (DUF218 family)
VILALIQAPAFLLVSDAPAKSDAVVLFIGNDKGTREKEARQLMQEGFAEYLIIPAYRQVKKLDPDGTLVRSDVALPLSSSNQSNQLNKSNQWNWIVEDTHQEAIIAKAMMEQLGCKSAILVSSPYHMRRIQLISAHVFKPDASFPPFVKEGKGGFEFTTVPTRHEAPGDDLWLFDSHERKFVISEYMKILWFSVYSPFV